MSPKARVILTAHIPVDLWDKMNEKISQWAVERNIDPARSRTRWIVELIEREAGNGHGKETSDSSS